MPRVLVLLLLVLVACAKRAYEPTGVYEEAHAAERMAVKREAARPAPSAGAMATYDADFAAEAAPPPPPRDAPAPAADRMVHYDGYLELSVTSPREAIDRAVAIAEEAGGRVQRLWDRGVTLQVPVTSFQDVFDRLRPLGEVRRESISAHDVTEAFTALDLRVRTLEATRTRLVALLARATEDLEKLQLLAELQRVTEELDRTEARRRTLAELAALSTITLEAVPRSPAPHVTAGPTIDGFEWIGELSPFRRELPQAVGARLELPEPDGLVVLTRRGSFVAESADGAILWTHRLDNTPRGETAFWVDAVHTRLAPQFVDVRRETVGDWGCVSLRQPGEDPYRWWVCVEARGRRLHLAQAFFPGLGHEERYGAAVRASLSGEAP